MRRRGQALVEFALVLPVLMLVLLGFGEAASLFATQHNYQNGVDALAQWAAVSMSEGPGESWRAGWEPVVVEESTRTDCGDRDPEVTFPDVTHNPGDRVLVRWDCRYQPRITSGWEGLPVTVESEAVVPFRQQGPWFCPPGKPFCPPPEPSPSGEP